MTTTVYCEPITQTTSLGVLMQPRQGRFSKMCVCFGESDLRVCWQPDCTLYVTGRDAAVIKTEHKWSAGHLEDACLWTGVNSQTRGILKCKQEVHSPTYLKLDSQWSACPSWGGPPLKTLHLPDAHPSSLYRRPRKNNNKKNMCRGMCQIPAPLVMREKHYKETVLFMNGPSHSPHRDVYLWVVEKLGRWIILLVQTYGEEQSTHTVMLICTLSMDDSKQTHKSKKRKEIKWVLDFQKSYE